MLYRRRGFGGTDRSAKLCSRSEAAGPRPHAKQDDRGTGESQSGIAEVASGVGGDGATGFRFAIFRRALQDEGETAARESGPSRSLLSRHNFYDCQTVSQLRHPNTGRRAILLQGDMDVDADGSDSDRLPVGSGVRPTSSHSRVTSGRRKRRRQIHIWQGSKIA